MIHIVSTWTGNKYPVTMTKPLLNTRFGYVVVGFVKTQTHTFDFSAYAMDPFQAVVKGLAKARSAILQTERRLAAKRGIRKVKYKDFTLTGLKKILWPYAAYVGFMPPLSKLPPWEAVERVAL